MSPCSIPGWFANPWGRFSFFISKPGALKNFQSSAWQGFCLGTLLHDTASASDCGEKFLVVHLDFMDLESLQAHPVFLFS